MAECSTAVSAFFNALFGSTNYARYVHMKQQRGFKTDHLFVAWLLDVGEKFASAQPKQKEDFQVRLTNNTDGFGDAISCKENVPPRTSETVASIPSKLNVKSNDGLQSLMSKAVRRSQTKPYSSFVRGPASWMKVHDSSAINQSHSQNAADSLNTRTNAKMSQKIEQPIDLSLKSANICCSPTSGGDTSPCPVCRRRFDRGYLKIHIRTHTGERPHRCHTCSRSFVQRSNLYKHVRRAHGLEMTDGKCSLCGQQFPCSDALTLHYRTAHYK